MSTIAEDIVSEVIKSQFQQEVLNKYSSIQSLFNYDGTIITGICSDNSVSISSDLSIFEPTEGIDGYINDFKNNVGDFVLQVDKAYKDGSTFLSALESIMSSIACVGGNPLLLNALGISTISDLEKLLHVPESFLDWVNTVLLKSLLSRINSVFPHIEFSLGINLSQIAHNILGNDIINLLSELDELIDCLYDSFNVDMRYIRTGIDAPAGFFSVNEILDSMYLGTSGSIDLNLLDLDVHSTQAIGSIIKTNKIIVNESLNNIAKVTKNFEIPPFIFNVS